MPLTLAQIALIDILSDKLITIIGAINKVPGMTEDEVKAETAKWEQVSDEEVGKIEDRQD